MDVTTDVQALLPPHEKDNHSPCDGTQVIDMTEDVGLTVGTCPQCRQTFVYLPKNNTWELEGEFEDAIRANSESLGSALSGLSG